MLSAPGVLERRPLEAAGRLADTLADRDLTRLFIALVVGFVLLAPSMKHSVVGFGEILFGIAAGTTHADIGSTFCATPRSRSWATSRAA